ncbi:M20/M25/M40 family metallo-hydrolase [Nocardioides sp. GY 10113]|uniref:M20/M25/M40 family metallo-hydrolase n=1 Tax=Nocardioides sp. GY 10113 TaxID=2569761 RepID=UPI0010A7F7EC|nr:M20/M25/M40 family metallo-hydrolase [Nocardioides sp. GY 10113]TIC88968.1 M20/M25/M40 family metallo-hydrolase [Nocardioides sp. GY 10113]
MPPHVVPPSDRAVEKLQTLVRIPTVSDRDPANVDTAAFDAFVDALLEQFPVLHEHLELTRVDTHGLLFRWPGESAARPVVLMAHLDVVPVGDEARWTHPPFSAEIHDGSVWGRGTLDDKGSLVAICEAVESLIGADVVPAQDVWLSFGCNEEVSGAAAILAVEELKRRGVRPWFVLDEGGAIAAEAFPGISAPVGVVGVTEKGVTSLELVATGDGGHASTPAKNGPTVRLARAITRLDAAPMPARLPDVTLELFRRMAPAARRPLRPVLRRILDAERLRPLVTRALLAAGPEAASMARTTFAVTTLSGSPALNVIASTAKAGVNIRIMVGDSVADVIAHVKGVIDDDSIRVDVIESNEPSPVSPYDDEAFALIERTITERFPDAVAAPYVMMAATDARFFTAICDRVYRFTPFRMDKAQRESIHTYDEHLGVQAFLDGIDWYRQLIVSLPEGTDPA